MSSITVSCTIRLYTLAGVLFLLLFFPCCGGGGTGGQGPGDEYTQPGSPPPSIRNISPERGCESGGVRIVIKGSDFTPDEKTRVAFGNVFAHDVQVLDTETITCLSPPHGIGTVNIAVNNIFGTGVLTDGFTYYIGSKISAVKPEQGSVAGGDRCVISGAHFPLTGDTRVFFGKTRASDVYIVDSETIRCTVPAHTPGVVGIGLAGDNGSDYLPESFTYHNLIGVKPDNGPMAGGRLLMIRGIGFTTTGDTSVTIGGKDVSQLSVINSTTVICRTPSAKEPGPVDVYVANSLGYDTLENGYFYSDLSSVTDVEPELGSATGGTTITITGKSFTFSADTTVTFGGTGAHNVTVVDPATITCETPAHSAGVVDVEVNNTNGTGILPGAFTYHNPPDLRTITPDNCSFSGGITVTLEGRNFSSTGATSVIFGGENASYVTVLSTSVITCVTPSHSPGVVDVEISNDFGSDTLSDGFTYNTAPNPPSVSDVTPDNGGVDGGTAITITGSDFTTTEDTSVAIGGNSALNVIVVSSKTITCVTPGHQAGTFDVVVANSFGSDTLPDAFTYNPSPDVTSVEPAEGGIAGGTVVTIKGSDFTNTADTIVTFGGNGAVNINVVNSGTITCETPSHQAGSVDVVVANRNGSGRLPGGFNYIAKPDILDLEHVKKGKQITLSWRLTAPGDDIVIYRGDQPIDSLSGNAVEYVHQENDLGYFR